MATEGASGSSVRSPWLALRLALREIRAHFRLSLMFVVGLALGLSGLGALDSLKVSIRSALSLRSKGILTADLGVSARRDLTDTELATITEHLPMGVETSHLLESLTMVATKDNSRLIELRVVEKSYPFYGEIELRKLGKLGPGAGRALFSAPTVWVYPELLVQLNLKPGDLLRIGNLDFTISDEILYDTAGAGSDVSFAPPIYMARQYFLQTGLLQKGSTAWRTLLVKLPPQFQDMKITETTAKDLDHVLHDPDLKVMTPKDASQQVGRALTYLGDYLGLASLVALFLTALGQVFLFRSYLVRRYRDMAVLKCLGTQNRTVAGIYFWQITLLSLLAALPAMAISALVLPPLAKPIHDVLNVDLHPSLQASTFWLLAFAAFWSSVTISGPLCLRTFAVSPRELLQPDEGVPGMPWQRWALYYLPAALSYYGMSVWLAKSVRVGSLFFFLLALSFALIGGCGYMMIQLLRRRDEFATRIVALRLALRHLMRTPFASLTAFVALALGVLLTNLIPQIEKGIQDELETPEGVEQPSLFLFDIQDDQIMPLQKRLAEMKLQPMMVSPMVRARLHLVNDVLFTKTKRGEDDENQTREQESENRSRNRGFNLTIRDQLSPSETLVKRYKGPLAAGLGEISLEDRFADRLDIHLGDKLTFDVQGIDVAGQVTSLRKVRWTSFQPNFFVQFRPGPLDEAPKTYLVTLPQLSSEQKLKVQRDLVGDFPNVTILDISRLVERLTSLLHQMGFALKTMGAFSLLVGFLILFSIASQSIYERRAEANLLKILGGRFALIEQIFIWEFLLLTISAVVLGTAFSFVISYTLTYKMFDALYAASWVTPTLVAAATIVISFFIVYFTISAVLIRQPKAILGTS